MALRQLLIAREMQALRTEQTQLSEALTGITERRTAWREREARAVQALEEITDQSTAEERAAFDAEAAEIEAERIQITADEEANTARSGEIATRLAELQTELDGLNARAANPGVPAPADTGRQPEHHNTERGHEPMEIRELCANEEVRSFLGNFRTVIRSGSVSGAKLTIPTLMLPLISKATERYSKLMKHVNHVVLNGEGKQNMLGSVPEAVWTDMAGKINPVDLVINQILTDGYKLGAYVAVPNPYLEDSDENLAMILIDLLGQANGYALDKGILYAIGTNSPIGISTRLTASSQPAWWQTNMPAFTDLHSTHVGTLSGGSVTGAALFKEMIAVLGKAKSTYNAGKGDKFWAMNESTWLQLQSELLSINAAGAVVTGAEKVMPVIGGAVEILDFVPDHEIIGGNGNQYLLVERKGVQVAVSEHALFLDDQTAFKATSRWDGIPVSGEGFAKFVLATSGTTAPELAEDVANGASATLSALSGTGLTLSPAFNAKKTEYSASVASTVANTTLTATAASGCTVTEIANNGTALSSGTTVTLSTGANVITVKVKKGTSTNVYTITVTKASA